MAFDFRLLMLSVAVALASFAGVYKFMGGSEPPLTVWDIRERLGELDRCTQRERQTKPCQPLAARAIAALKSLPPTVYDFHQSSTFDVAVTEDLIAVSKADCTPPDLVVDEFHWRAAPVDKSALPDKWKATGMASGIGLFSATGYEHNGTCLLVVKFPYQPLDFIEIGQYSRADTKWVWRIAEKIPVRK